MIAQLTGLSWALWALLGGLFGVPLAMLLWQAGGTTGGGGESWWALWTAPESTAALWGTLTTSAGAAAVAFVLAVPLALLIGRTALPMRGLLRGLFTLPAALPPFILAMGWVSLGNPRAGLLNLLLGPGTVDVYGTTGIAFVLGSAGLPMVLLPTLAALSRIEIGIGSSIDFASKTQRDAGARRPAVSAVVWTWTTPHEDGRRPGRRGERRLGQHLNRNEGADSPRTGLDPLVVSGPYAASAART